MTATRSSLYDLTGDGKVNFDDLLLAAQSYGKPLAAAADSTGLRR